MFKLRTREPVNCNYSSFWNDFTHYSLFSLDPDMFGLEPFVGLTPVNYFALQEQQELFTDPHRFINYLPEEGNARQMFHFSEEPYQ